MHTHQHTGRRAGRQAARKTVGIKNTHPHSPQCYPLLNRKQKDERMQQKSESEYDLLSGQGTVALSPDDFRLEPH